MSVRHDAGNFLRQGADLFTPYHKCLLPADVTAVFPLALLIDRSVSIINCALAVLLAVFPSADIFEAAVGI